MSLEKKEIFEFGAFRLDIDEHTIERIDGHKNGVLTEKAFQVLVLLVRRRGHLVSKDELITFVWPDTIVEDNNLEKCIHHLRQFLGETSDGTKYIETVRKHGYRFIGNVNAKEVSFSWLPETFRADGSENGSAGPIGDQRAEPDTEFQDIVETGKRNVANARYPFRSTVVLFAIVLTLIGGVALAYFLNNRTTTNPVGTRSIAVLLFKPINAVNRDDLYEVGLAESVIHQLSPVNGLIVRPLSAVRAYTEIGQDPVAAGREQKVDYVLDSTYQIAEGRIRITSRLINVATGQVEAPYKFDKEVAGVFATQDAVTVEIGNKLIARLGGTATGRATKRGTSNEDAYRLYLDGMYFYDKRGSSNAQKSVEKMEQAVGLDPNYALAWAGKGLAYIGAMSSGKGYTSEGYQRSVEAINKALALDPNLSDAHSTSCLNKYRFEHDFTGAELECKRALELDPKSSVAHQIYSHLLMDLRRPDEAIAAIKTAIGLDPTSYFNQRTYANLLYYDRRYDEAVVQYNQVIEMGSDQNFATYDWLIRALEMQGKEPEAFEGFIKYLKLRNQDDETIGRFRTAYQTSGWQGVLRERDRTFDESFSSYFRRAAWNASLGNKDKAFEYLEIAFQRHDSVVGSLLVEPIFDLLRDDPRYADLARRIQGR